MPDTAMHYYFGQDVLEALPEEIRAAIDHGVYDFALTGPDDWSLYRFWSRSASGGIGRRSNIMHTTRTNAFLTALTAEAQKSPLMFSYLAGFLCHHALDSTCHPYINAFAARHDGVREKPCYASNHVAMERDLDNWILQKRGNHSPHPIARPMMGCKRLPEAMKEPIDRIYRELYGWENAYHELNRCKADYRKFLLLMEDPHGIMKRISLLPPYRKIKEVPYSRAYFPDGDVLNRNHRPWEHPLEPGVWSEKSFEELLEESKQEALARIPAAFRGETGLIGSVTYEGGQDRDA